MRRKLSGALFLALCLVMHLVSLAQIENYLIGDNELKKAKKGNPALAFVSLIGSMNTHTRIGGISFEQVAVPSDSLLAQQMISIKYDPNKSDGYRATISFGNNPDSVYPINLPDWQLVPIARYADSVYTAIFTRIWFSDSSETPIRYHSAFINELLGLRMFQADMMFSGPEMAGIPRNKVNNKPVIATSEKVFKLDTSSRDNYYDLKLMIPYYSSYILTDWGKEIRFGVQGHSFYVSGEPYYLFTNHKADVVPRLYRLKNQLESLKERIRYTNDSSYSTLIRLARQQNRTASQQQTLMSRFSDLNNRYNLSDHYLFYMDLDQAKNTNDTISAIVNADRTAREIKRKINDDDFKKLDSILNRDFYTWTGDAVSDLLEKINSKHPYERMSLYYWMNDHYDDYKRIEFELQGTAAIEELNQKIFEFNPVVSNSCIVTARYAALFRYIREKNPAAWADFIQAIKENPGRREDFNDSLITPDQIRMRNPWND